MTDNQPRGDFLIMPDPPPYPRDWTPEQRVTAYWEAVKQHRFPLNSNGWYGLLSQAAGRHEHIEGILAQTALDYEEGPA